MKVTTSRDPSARARRFGRLLAAFLSVPYITRGKQSLDEKESWLVVVEDHGNPTGLTRRFEGRTETMAFAVLSESEGVARSRRLKSLTPMVTGEKEDALSIARFFELDLVERPPSDVLIGRSIKVASGQIDFVDEGKTLFRLKI
jgi:U3 small nucleolar ribonucleoprotein protein IMP4